MNSQLFGSGWVNTENMEARIGVEPTNKGFADLRSTPVTIVESASISRSLSFRPVSVRSAALKAKTVRLLDTAIQPRWLLANAEAQLA